MTSRISLLSAGLLSLFILAPNAANAASHGVNVGNLEITNAWVRAAPPNARNGGGYLTITNHGMVGDKLLSATSNVSPKTELHTHINDNGVMRMRQVPHVVVPMRGQAVFKPGGLHIMFMGLKTPLKVGGTVMLKLRFEKAGEVMVHAPIKKGPDMKMKMPNHSHDMNKMKKKPAQ
jgi:periplasmic copper chaperone A